MTMKFSDLETIYEQLAITLDRIDAQSKDIFLAKLALVLAHELDNPEIALTAIEKCSQHCLEAS